MRRLAFSPLLLVLFVAVPALADGGNYITHEQLDLTKVLAPPPAQDSPTTTAEIGQLLLIQQVRTPDQAAAAQADATEDVFRFANVMGPDFTADKLPVAKAFFARVAEDEGYIVDPAKDVWKRPRPHIFDPRVKPVVPLSKSGAYPSGHASFAYLTAVVLANMVPEKQAEIFARAADYAHNRVIGGIHYASDIDAGRIAGTLIASQELRNAKFQEDFAAARAEVRRVLGYGG
ncbi:phosphatase PAP2 family protein [Ancylobacter sonchi]|uniref:acid phosphatase n=1 Tax=Ancylobacter sonchi TaxID=1937790 RepID=UPI001BD3732E|nr:phosphatase PAP2 family protein [Ancylobacter sonchi]MBS7535510.1 phosphatase PAP2 family protein [Ancylobacter sonchi]